MPLKQKKSQFKPLCEITIFRGQGWERSVRVVSLIPKTPKNSPLKLASRIKRKHAI